MNRAKGLELFWRRQSEWSQRTFGPDEVRGPKGPLKHLLKEIQNELLGLDGKLDDLEEYADLLFLCFDATRRAGFTCDQLVAKAWEKLAKNEARTWPDWRTMDAEDAIEHDRSEE